MNRILCLILLSLGTVLVIFGLNALDSVSSAFSRLFTGTPTDKALWLLIAGGGFLLVGGIGLVRSPKPTWKRS